jgi:hypothetical protein
MLRKVTGRTKTEVRDKLNPALVALHLVGEPSPGIRRKPEHRPRSGLPGVADQYPATPAGDLHAVAAVT